MRLLILVIVLSAGCRGDDLAVDAEGSLYQLRIMNSGGGRVVAPPTYIDCGTQCTWRRESGSVTLVAEPAAGRTFLGWGGAEDCTGTGPCQVTMDADRVIWPNFAPPTPVFARGYGAADNAQLVIGESGLAAVAFDAAGDLVVAGWVAGPVVVDGVSYPDRGGEDIWIAKLSSLGMLRWARRIGGAGQDRALAVAVATDGTVRVTGYCNGAIDFGSGSITSAGVDDVFVLALANDGSTAWSRTFGGSGHDQGSAVLANPDGTMVSETTLFETRIP